MAQIILSGDGLTIEIPDEIAQNDDLLKRALAPHYPDLANALITREEQDGLLKVTLAKRAGPKGSAQESDRATKNPVALALDDVPDYLNPALALAWQLHFQHAAGKEELTLEKQLALQGTISEAILEGEAEAAQVEKAVEWLEAAPTVAALQVPKGF
jgi:hypothetical protein